MDTEKLLQLANDLEADIDAAEAQLAPLLSEPLQLQAEKQGGRKAAVPYALAAYSLSSLIFAYLRSEGEPIDLIQGEIERVQKLVQKIESSPSEVSSPASSSPAAKKERKDMLKAAEEVRREKRKKKMFK